MINYNILENHRGEIDKIFMCESSQREPMVTFIFDENGVKNSVNQVITQGFQIEIVCEALRKLYPEQAQKITFKSFKQFDNLLKTLSESKVKL